MEDHGVGRCSEMVYRALHHPLLLVLVLAIAARLILSPLLTYEFDIYHWGVIIENIQTGNGLYELDGYYYTPTWGYILGFMTMVQDALLNIDVFGIRFTELLAAEGLEFRFHTATVTSVDFNLFMKIPLIVCDAVVAYLLYRLIVDRTGSERKGVAGAALWMFCPTVLYMSGIQAQFDTISALMMLLTVLLVYRDRCFLAGIVFSAAVLLKFFPAFTILVLAAYILVRHRDDGLGRRRLIEAVLGAGIGAAVLLAPQIMDGTITDTLAFIFNRMDSNEEMLFTLVTSYLTMAIAVLGMLFAGYRMYRTEPAEADTGLFDNVLLALAATMLMSATPQYMMVMLPFLLLYLVAKDGRMMWCWILISVGTFMVAIVNNNFMLLDSAWAYLGIGSADWIVDMAYWFEEPVLFGVSTMMILMVTGGFIYYAGMILFLGLFFRKYLEEKAPKVGSMLSGLRRWGYD